MNLTRQGFKVRQTSMGVVLMVASASCSALSLGSVQGRVVIGRPVDLRVPVHLAPEEVGANLCPVVRLHFGDLPVGGRDVSISLINGSDAVGRSGTSLRVESSTSVNEPFVVMDLTVGCATPLSRNYVLLADPASVDLASAHDSNRNATRLVGSKLTEPSVHAATASTRSDPSPSAGGRAAKQKRPSPGLENDRFSPAATGKRLSLPSGPRLTLDPLALVVAEGSVGPVLRMSTEAVFSAVNEEAAPELQAKREAARALWRVLNSPPEEVAALAAKGTLLESEATELRSQLTQARAAEEAARMQLTQEQQERLTRPVAYGLVAGLLGVFAAFAWVWYRRRSTAHGQASPWWKRDNADQALSAGQAIEPSPVTAATRRGTASIDIDVDTLFPAEKFRASEASVSGWAAGGGGRLHGGSDFLHSTLMDGARSVATEELFDLQQQVEFFISLGQADQAVDVLVSHIADSQEPSPLAYLDLLKLYHELGRKSDYENLRQSFNAQFIGGAPEFDHYSHSRRGLERYEAALARIQAEWPHRSVLQVIERAIFRHDPDTPVEVFDLEAYRELLLLYGIAREVIAWNEEGGGPPLPPVMAMPVADAHAHGDGKEVESAFEATVPDSMSVPLAESFLPPVVSDLDIDLSSGYGLDSSLLDESEPTGDVPTRGGSSSMALALPEGLDAQSSDVQSDLAATGAAPARPNTSGHEQTVDFDFSDLGEVDSFTIKKSGSPGSS